MGTLSRRHFGAAETLDRTSPSSSKGIFLCLIGGDVLGSMRIAGFAGPPVLGSAMNVTVSYISFCSFFLLALGEFNGTGLKRSTVFFARFLTILEDWGLPADAVFVIEILETWMSPLLAS